MTACVVCGDAVEDPGVAVHGACLAADALLALASLIALIVVPPIVVWAG